MEKVFTIASFNIQNQNLKKKEQKLGNAKEIKALVEKEKIDVLSLQEAVSEIVNSMKKEFKGFHIIGKYRYGENFFTKKIPLLRKYNEATPIITNYPIIETENYSLPWIPKSFSDLKKSILEYRSITPRILTETLIEIGEGQKIKVFNTHLEKRILRLKSRQLKKILKVISNSEYPVVLTGDFNMGLDQALFQKFVQQLKDVHLKRVPIDEKTWKYAKKNIAIDHIFVPEDWCVLSKKVVDNQVGDHYLILAQCKIVS